DPKQALAEAISYDDRKRLPQSIVSLLEEPVNGKGDYYVLGAVAAPGGAKPEKTIQRKALVNGKTYDAYVYGWRLHQVTREGMSFNAIGVPPRNPGEPPRLAVGEPVRTLSALEAKDAIASGRAKQEAICSVSGNKSTSEGQQTLAQVGDRIVNLCQPSHAQELNRLIAASESQFRTSIRASGSYGTNLPPEPNSITQGRFTLLYMRVRFSDDPTEVISEGAANAVMNGVDRFFVACSYNTASIIGTITQLLT